MKKLIAVGGLVVLVISGATSATARPAPRVEKVEYKQPATGAYTPIVWAWAFDCIAREGCVVVPIRSKDRFLSLKLLDKTGLPVYAQLRNPGSQDVLAHVYGGTEEPLPVKGPAALTLHILAGVSPNGEPSAPTTGVVEMTFTRR